MDENMKENEKIKNNEVDVVIPLYKPGNELAGIIDKLSRQTCHISNIILINTECEGYDETKMLSWNNEITSKQSEDDRKANIVFKSIQKNQFNHGLTRNMGMLLSEAEFVVFMTQDAIPKNKYLIEELLKPFEDEDVYVAYARQLPRNNCKYVERYVRQFNYPDYDIVKTKETFEQYGIKNIFCSDVCAAYRRDQHVKIGGFQKTDFNEDMIYAYDVIMSGKKVYYASKAKVIHSHNYSYIQQFNRNIQIGRSQKEFDYIFANLKSEDEGIKMLLNGIRYLMKNKKWYYVPDLIISTGFKYAGYQIGKHGV